MFKYIASLATELREKGVFNMLLSDGRYVMAFCSTNLFWITRRAPFGVAKLLDQDVEIDFQKETTPNDVVTVIATQPLTGNETWQKIMPGEWALFCLGERRYDLTPAWCAHDLRVVQRLADAVAPSKR